MSNEYDCYECGNRAHYIDIQDSYMYCLPCIREMYPPIKTQGGESE
jgi:hypothetical protein